MGARRQTRSRRSWLTSWARCARRSRSRSTTSTWRALQAAAARGVRLRIVFNQDYGTHRAAPPPPEMSDWPFVKELPEGTWFPVNGDPDLMHHKYVVRDSESVWTGSANWTTDSWSREENVIVRVDAPAVAA